MSSIVTTTQQLVETLAAMGVHLTAQQVQHLETQYATEGDVGAGARPTALAMQVPHGWQLVPNWHNMTDEQAEAVAKVANCCGGRALDIYIAAMEAAPQYEPAYPCWACNQLVTKEERAEHDGLCPYCHSELDLEDWPVNAVSEAQASPQDAGYELVGYTLSTVYQGVRRVGEIVSWMGYFEPLEEALRKAQDHLQFLLEHRPQAEPQLVELYAKPKLSDS